MITVVSSDPNQVLRAVALTWGSRASCPVLQGRCREKQRGHQYVRPHLRHGEIANKSLWLDQPLEGGGTCCLLFHCGWSLVTLYRGGWPTSVVLLLLMIVAKLALPLSRHPPLGLHHLLRLVGAARGLVSLGGIEVLEIRRRGPRPAIKLDRLRALGPAGTTGVCWGKCQLGRWGCGPAGADVYTHQTWAGFWQGREKRAF